MPWQGTAPASADAGHGGFGRHSYAVAVVHGRYECRRSPALSPAAQHCICMAIGLGPPASCWLWLNLSSMQRIPSPQKWLALLAWGKGPSPEIFESWRILHISRGPAVDQRELVAKILILCSAVQQRTPRLIPLIIYYVRTTSWGYYNSDYTTYLVMPVRSSLRVCLVRENVGFDTVAYQLVSNYELIRLKRFVTWFSTKLCN
jgi:hypothetical protein